MYTFGGTLFVWQAALNGPSDCCLLAPRPLCISSSSVAGPHDLLPVNGIWWKWWDFTSEVGLHGTGISILELLQVLVFSLACSDGRCQCHQLPYKEDHMAKNWGLWSLANSQQRTEALSPMNHPNNFGSWKEIIPHSSSEMSPATANIFPEVEEPAKLLPEADPQQLCTHKCIFVTHLWDHFLCSNS